MPGLEHVSGNSPAIADPPRDGAVIPAPLPRAGDTAVAGGVLGAGRSPIERAVGEAVDHHIPDGTASPAGADGPLDGVGRVIGDARAVAVGRADDSPGIDLDPAERDYRCRERLLDEFEAYDEIEEDW